MLPKTNTQSLIQSEVLIFPISHTGVYEHMLLQVLNACESDSTGWTLEGPVGAIGARPS